MPDQPIKMIVSFDPPVVKRRVKERTIDTTPEGAEKLKPLAQESVRLARALVEAHEHSDRLRWQLGETSTEAFQAKRQVLDIGRQLNRANLLIHYHIFVDLFLAEAHALHSLEARPRSIHYRTTGK